MVQAHPNYRINWTTTTLGSENQERSSKNEFQNSHFTPDEFLVAEARQRIVQATAAIHVADL